MTWWWRPERVVDREPLPTDYRCCCGCCTSKCGFTFITAMNLAFIGLLSLMILPGIILGGPIFWLLVLIPFLIICIWMYPSVQAIRTEKPIYMQVVWIMNLIATGISLAYLTAQMLLALVAVIGAKDHTEKQRALAIFYSQLASLIFDIPWTIWALCLVYSFYSYLRDRQLWLESRETGNQLQKVHQIESAPMYEP